MKTSLAPSLRTRASLAALATVLLALSTVLAAEKPTPVVAGISKGSHTKWSDAYFFDGDDVQIRAVALPTVGGRIVEFSRAFDNILFEAPDSQGKTLTTTTGWFSMGGYQLDVGPEIRGIPEHLNLWLGPWTADAPEEYTLSLTSPKDTTLGIQLHKRILVDPETGDLGITQQLRNISDREVRYCLWDRTLCAGGGYVIVPLKKNSRFPNGWSVRQKLDGKYTYNGSAPTPPGVKVSGGYLIVNARGPALKLGADSDAGWIAYVRNQLLFIKYFPVDPAGTYSDGGNTVEIYIDEQVAELEPLSPEVALAPGATYDFPEKWSLVHLKKPVTDFDEARSAARRVPPSPFK